MKRAFWILAALTTSLAPAARADDAPFQAQYFGEGGGYKESDRATDQYLEGDTSRRAPRSGTAATSPLFPALPSPRSSPVSGGAPPGAASFPFRATPLPRPPAKRGSSAASSSPRQSLWNGLVQPLDMGPGRVDTADPAEARAGGERDYESHILSLEERASRPLLAPRGGRTDAGASAAKSAELGATPGGRIFVSVEMDPRESGSLRDAIAGLGAAAGFSADVRFEPRTGPDGSMLISGWMPSASVAAALSRPGVKRLQVEARARPGAARETAGDFLVGLRVDGPGAAARAGVESGVRVLSSTAGFDLRRVVGLETAPDGRSVAVIVGRLPLARLSKAMGLSEVAKISPLGGEPASVVAMTRRPSPAGFARFVARRWPWLILLTLLLVLPGLRAPARRFLRVFNPYR